MLVLLVVTFLFTKSRWNHGDLSDPDKMIERIENALGDDFKKQTKTEVVATLVYGNGKESDNINYHILKTTYYEADPNDVTGLNVDALGVLFNPETAVSCETMKIQEWDAALYKTKEHCYLCWTYSPEVGCPVVGIFRADMFECCQRLHLLSARLQTSRLQGRKWRLGLRRTGRCTAHRIRSDTGQSD